MSLEDPKRPAPCPWCNDTKGEALFEELLLEEHYHPNVYRVVCCCGAAGPYTEGRQNAWDKWNKRIEDNLSIGHDKNGVAETLRKVEKWAIEKQKQRDLPNRSLIQDGYLLALKDLRAFLIEEYNYRRRPRPSNPGADTPEIR